MGFGSLIAVTLAASCAASALPQSAGDAKRWVSVPITHGVESRSISRRDTDVPLYNVSVISYLVECEFFSVV
jgi:hypothetical protein